jgi:hypothetical protein
MGGCEGAISSTRAVRAARLAQVSHRQPDLDGATYTHYSRSGRLLHDLDRAFDEFMEDGIRKAVADDRLVGSGSIN